MPGCPKDSDKTTRYGGSPCTREVQRVLTDCDPCSRQNKECPAWQKMPNFPYTHQGPSLTDADVQRYRWNVRLAFVGSVGSVLVGGLLYNTYQSYKAAKHVAKEKKSKKVKPTKVTNLDISPETFLLGGELPAKEEKNNIISPETYPLVGELPAKEGEINVINPETCPLSGNFPAKEEESNILNPEKFILAEKLLAEEESNVKNKIRVADGLMTVITEGKKGKHVKRRGWK